MQRLSRETNAKGIVFSLFYVPFIHRHVPDKVQSKYTVCKGLLKGKVQKAWISVRKFDAFTSVL